MKNLLRLALLLLLAQLAFGQAANIPVCTGAFPGQDPTACTDYFGVANWANSPLPAGTITGYTLITGGSGYTNPTVTVTDPTGATLSGAEAPTPVLMDGVIVGFTGGLNGTQATYTAPVITITDPTGSGAMVSATLGPPYTGGIKKFQDGFFDLKNVIAIPDGVTFPGSDYYEIALVEYTQKMHSSLPATKLRGYVQVPSGSTGCGNALAAQPTYLGPVILAQKNRPVRVKFTNCLPTGAAGDLFIPMDSTYMGADMSYTQNRATLHLHGGNTPWISDGTPHQWTVPVGDGATHKVGDAVAYVPDMWFDSTGMVIPGSQCSSSCNVTGSSNNPGDGALTFFWTNQQGGRLMFYHDHAYGLTRLNVYAGEAAGYLIYDPQEEAALLAAGAPGTIAVNAQQTNPDLAHLIPLVIQDKSFVPSQPQLLAQDPTWIGHFGANPPDPTGAGGMGNGDLWFPHIYMPNQNPNDPVGGANSFGRWDYGPWFFPPQTTLTAANPPSAVTTACTSAAFPGSTLAPVPNSCPTCGCPITPNPSGTPEAFMDTPVVNGVAYPVMHVAPAAYRFKILSAGNDRSLNLSWFVADGTQNNTEVAMLPAAPPSKGVPMPLCSMVNPVAVPGLVLGLVTGLTDGTGNPLNGTGLPAGCWPNYGPQPGIPVPQTMWAADGRIGGAPDPRNAGPAWIQIGSEGGLLPAPVVIPPTPVNYEQNVRSITIGSVAMHGLWLGPAERADVIVDFSKFAGKTLILYNDAPAPAPALDARLDYFTDDGDNSMMGGAPNTPAGYGPNTRTIMQVVVDSNNPNTVPFTLRALSGAFKTTLNQTGIFAATQPATIVPEPQYNSAYNGSFPANYASIQALDMVVNNQIAPQKFNNSCGTNCDTMDQKTIQELFTVDYGRMNATLGTELPNVNFQNQTTVPLGYIDPATEIIRDGNTQLWKITHNGVDSHWIHFHLFNVQVINRVGWDGSIRPIDANEAGWKDTVRMNPLEDIVVALQPFSQNLPFPLRNSVRLMDVTNMGTFTGVNPFTNNPFPTSNAIQNFGWEYVWHCHILGHEENDMMRPIIFQVPPPAPSNLTATFSDPPTNSNVNLSFTDNSASETGFVIERDTDPTFPNPTPLAIVPPTPPLNDAMEGTTWGNGMTASDILPDATLTYYYRAQAVDDGWANSMSQTWNRDILGKLNSAWSNVASPVTVQIPPTVTFNGAPAAAPYNSTFVVTATTNASTMPTITATGVCSVGPVAGTPATATASVTMTSGTGTCQLTADWAQDANFLAATAGPLNTNAAPAAPTVSFTGAPVNAIINTSFNVVATTNSDVAALPTISGTPGVCTVGPIGGTPSNANATVTVTAASGTCTLTANWSATSNYAAATATQNTQALPLKTPTITFTGAPASAVYKTSFTVTATTNASTVPAITGTLGVCSVGTVSGQSPATATVTMDSGAGTCVLTANWGADATYAAANASQSTVAQVATPAVTFTGAPAIGIYNTTFTVNATTTADVTTMPVIAGGGVCSVAAPTGTPTNATATVKMTSGTGTCSLVATWPATQNYTSAIASQSTTAQGAVPTVSLTGTPTTAAYNSSFTVTATTNANDATQLPTISGTAGVCTAGPVTAIGLQGAGRSTVTMISGTGVCVVTANFPATTNYVAAAATQSATATKLNSSTQLLSNTPSHSVVGQPVTISFKSFGSGPSLPSGNVTVTATTGETCTGTLDGTGNGSCVITFATGGGRNLRAGYAGDANYNPSNSTSVAQYVGNFSMTVSPTSATVNGNAIQRYTITLTPLNGFSGTVTVSPCSSTPTLPGSYTCNIAPTSVTLVPGTSQKVVATVTTGTGFPGTYTFTFTSTYDWGGGTLTKSVSAKLINRR